MFALGPHDEHAELIGAVNYLLANLGQQNTLIVNSATGQIISPFTGQVVSYLYQYINIRYATSRDGIQGFSQSPTGATYYGIRNSDSPVGTEVPSQYVWNLASPPFGTTNYLWYSTIGGRQILWVVAATAPSAFFQQVQDNVPINLDVTTNTSNTTQINAYARIPNNPTPVPGTIVTTGQTLPPQVQSFSTWNLNTAWTYTDPNPSSSDSLYITNGSYNLTTNETTWNTPYVGEFNVTQLSQITPNAGSLTSGTIGGNMVVNTTGNVTANVFTGNGSGLTNLTGANVTGEVSFAATANSVAGANVTGTVNLANYVVQANQANITSVGNLTGLTVVGTTTTTDLIVLDTITSDPSFGQFWSNVTQTAPINTITAVTYNNSDAANKNVSVVSSSQITITRAGQYDIQFSAQIDQSGGGTHNVYFWLRKNGADVADSGGNFTIDNVTQLVAGWNWLVTAGAGDYYEIMWATDANVVTLPTLPAQVVPYARPSSPSVIVTITPVGAN